MQISMFAGQDKPDTVFIICINIDSGSLEDGDCVSFGSGNIANLGLAVGKSSVPDPLVAGIVRGKTAQVGEYVTVQVYGLHPNAKVDGAKAASTVLTSGVSGQLATGLVGDDPAHRVGVCLRNISSTRAAVMIRLM